MTLFLVFAAVLTLASAGLIARSLLRAPARGNASSDELNAAVYRDQLAELERAVGEGSIDASEHAHARDAIRRRLAEELQPHAALAESLVSRGTAFVATALLVVGAGALYAMLGSPAALSPQPQAAAAADPNAHGLQAQQILAMVERLAVRLKENPDDVNGWVMLGRSYSALGRFDEAARGYAEAVKRSPADANLLADHADVLAMAQGRKFDGEPDRLIARALQADGNHVKSLALAGTSAFGRKEYAKAVEYWSRIRQQVPAGSDMARSIETSIRQASALASGTTPVSATATAAAQAAPVAQRAGATVSGSVVLAPAMAQRVKPGDTLFIYARSPEGSRMPLAIVRQPVGTWPAVFTLDDSSAMSPASRISGQPQVVLEARVSRSGSATPVAGDLRGTVGPVALGEQGVRIEIGAVVQ